MQHVYFDTHAESYLCIYRGDLSLFADLSLPHIGYKKVLLRRVSLVKFLQVTAVLNIGDDFIPPKSWFQGWNGTLIMPLIQFWPRTMPHALVLFVVLKS